MGIPWQGGNTLLEDVAELVPALTPGESMSCEGLLLQVKWVSLNPVDSSRWTEGT